MKYFFMRLEKYIAVRPTAAMTDIIVQIMVEVISILGIATKEIKERRISMPFLVFIYPAIDVRAEKFLKRLFGINRLDDAFQRLDTLTQEEARMAEAETMEIAARTDKNVIEMAANVAVIDEGVKDGHVIMAGVNDKVEIAHVETQAVHRKVSLIKAGDIFCSSLTLGCVLTLTRLGVTEAREEIQVVIKDVSDLNRS